MTGSKPKWNGLVFCLIGLFVVAGAIAFTPAWSTADHHHSEHHHSEIWIVVGADGSCGDTTGSFSADYKGKAVQVSFAYNALKVYKGKNSRLSAADARSLLCPSDSDTGANQVAGKKILAEGKWTSDTDFEAQEFHYDYEPKHEHEHK